MNKCKVDGCKHKVVAYGYCERHARQIKNNGNIVSQNRSRLDKNEIIELQDYAIIYLYNNFGNKIGFSLIDLVKVGIAKEHKWHKDKYGYVLSDDSIKLHRIIVGIDDPCICVDHINRDTLDNRMINLRLASKSQNAMNGNIRASNTSGFKGVVKSGARWRAQIKVNYKNIHIGRFEDPREAAKAYDEACIGYHGEFGTTNMSLGLLG